MKHYLTLLILLLLTRIGFSQADTLEVGQDTLKPSEEKYDRIYKLFVEDQGRETKRLWKLNLVDMAQLGPNLSIEQGLGQGFTSETYLGLKKFAYGSYYGFSINTEFSQQLKYYFNLKAREQKGKRYSGFSANYISLMVFSNYQLKPNVGYFDRFTDRPSGIINMHRIAFRNGVGLLVGMQRRIGNIGYIDLFAGVKYYHLMYENQYPEGSISDFSDTYESGSYMELMPVIGLRAGFAIDSFKHLKYMLK